MKVLPFGDRALLLELDTLDEVLALYPALDNARVDGVTDLVPGARSILLHVDPRRLPLGAAEHWARSVRPGSARPPAGRVVSIDVRYDGPDILEAARLADLSPHDLVLWHTSTAWTVAFTGFAPGFAYLTAEHRRIFPRRATPRTRVPAGAVGLAGEFSGVYPRPSPGGWQIIGTAAAVLWDPDRPEPALLTPGTVVRFSAS